MRNQLHVKLSMVIRKKYEGLVDTHILSYTTIISLVGNKDNVVCLGCWSPMSPSVPGTDQLGAVSS